LADIIDFLTMYPDARRRLRMLGEIDQRMIGEEPARGGAACADRGEDDDRPDQRGGRCDAHDGRESSS
jgi:hypothetical protein